MLAEHTGLSSEVDDDRDCDADGGHSDDADGGCYSGDDETGRVADDDTVRTETVFIEEQEQRDMKRTVNKLLCSHNFTEKSVYLTEQQLIESCTDCGKERVRPLPPSDPAS